MIAQQQSLCSCGKVASVLVVNEAFINYPGKKNECKPPQWMCEACAPPKLVVQYQMALPLGMYGLPQEEYR